MSFVCYLHLGSLNIVRNGEGFPTKVIDEDFLEAMESVPNVE